MSRLDTYRRKRDFERTSEPAGARSEVSDERRFVIQKHAASQLHYDLCLEADGVLRSWALPKGPSLAPGERRLAVEVEDHPIDYGSFEGTIPAGEYGGGTVMLWDRGRWAPTGRGMSDDRIDFELEGEKLRGSWTLTRSRRGNDEASRNWLLIKRTDDGAPPLDPDDDHSVHSGRTMAQIAADADGAASDADDAAAARGATAPDDATAADDAANASSATDAGDDFGAPCTLQLATLAKRVPDEGDGWLFEIKFDGYRIVAEIDDARVRLLSRNGHDWTGRFPEIASAIGALPMTRARFDGEIVALRPDGVSDFQALQEAIERGATARLTYQAFDLLFEEGADLRDRPLVERKVALRRVLDAATGTVTGRVRYTDHVETQGPAFYAHACRLGLEGVIAKRRDAPYRGGRGKRWLKVKCGNCEAFVVGGATPPAGSRQGFGSLLLGAYRDGALVYQGRVGSGFGDRLLARIDAGVRAQARSTSPFDGPVPDARGATWTEPVLVVDVAFTERTRAGRLRHPTFVSLREGADPSQVIVAAAGASPAGAPPPPPDTAAADPENADPGVASPAAPAPPSGPPPKRSKGRRRAVEVAGVRLTNADRVLYPNQGLTKLDLAHYYERNEPNVLPGLVNRPLALVRCPTGRDGSCFYQKHPGRSFPSDLPLVSIEQSEGPRDHAYVTSLADLIGLVQIGVLELHVWGCRVDDVERPDRMVFDLDPSPDVPWARTRATAGALRERLDALGLSGFVRTTGGKGLHVVVPLQRRHGWEEVKGFARALCQRLAEDDPERRTISVAKAKRGGKVFLDYLRNGRGATAVASYSTRARPGAPVALPVRWDELDSGLKPDGYHVGNVGRRLAALQGDPWAGFEDAASRLTLAVRDAVGAP